MCSTLFAGAAARSSRHSSGCFCNCFAASNALHQHANSAGCKQFCVYFLHGQGRMSECARLDFINRRPCPGTQRTQQQFERILSSSSVSLARIRTHTVLPLVCISFLLSPFFCGCSFICFPQKKGKVNRNHEESERARARENKLLQKYYVGIRMHFQFIESLHRHNVDFHTRRNAHSISAIAFTATHAKYVQVESQWVIWFCNTFLNEKVI